MMDVTLVVIMMSKNSSDRINSINENITQLPSFRELRTDNKNDNINLDNMMINDGCDANGNNDE